MSDTAIYFSLTDRLCTFVAEDIHTSIDFDNVRSLKDWQNATSPMALERLYVSRRGITSG